MNLASIEGRGFYGPYDRRLNLMNKSFPFRKKFLLQIEMVKLNLQIFQQKG